MIITTLFGLFLVFVWNLLIFQIKNTLFNGKTTWESYSWHKIPYSIVKEVNMNSREGNFISCNKNLHERIKSTASNDLFISNQDNNNYLTAEALHDKLKNTIQEIKIISFDLGLINNLKVLILSCDSILKNLISIDNISIERKNYLNELKNVVYDVKNTDDVGNATFIIENENLKYFDWNLIKYYTKYEELSY